MAIIEISIVPVGTETASVSKYVAKVLRVLEKEKNIKYELTSMGTIIEGDPGRILNVAKKMHRAVFDREIKRVVTIIKIDERTDKKLTMNGKINSVKRTH